MSDLVGNPEDNVFSSPEPKAHGELIVYQSTYRLCVCKHYQTLADCNQILSVASLDRKKECIRVWTRSDQNSGVNGNR